MKKELRTNTYQPQDSSQLGLRSKTVLGIKLGNEEDSSTFESDKKAFDQFESDRAKSHVLQGLMDDYRVEMNLKMDEADGDYDIWLEMWNTLESTRNFWNPYHRDEFHVV